MDETSVTADLAMVVYVSDSNTRPFEVVINRGRRHGIRPGARYLVFGYGPEVTDPDTGESLGRVELVRGRGEVEHLQDNLATLRSIERERDRRGKRVTRQGGGLGMFAPVIEEEIEADPKPFENVCIGDLARPI